MCGICGIWHTDRQQTVAPALLSRMLTTLRHRGPDDEGYLFVDTAGLHRLEMRGQDTLPQVQMPDIRLAGETSFDLAFGSRRLSILDLSPAGHQPMGNADGSIWITYNGEIYNYLELRTELEARKHTFRTGTDTEVILAAYEEWGEACLGRLNGMWALALWDGRRQRLFCARDRFGIKPFYYFWDGRTFAFASEIKALLQVPAIEARANDAIIHDFLSYGYLDHTDETFFLGIRQLVPAQCLTVRDGQIETASYWSVDPERKADPVPGGTDQAQALYDLFEDAVRIHLRSDVPIGTCLSGGLDSSAIVCVANKLLFADGVLAPELVGRQQKTFSSCSEDLRFDERRYIEQVTAATDTESNYVFPTAQGLLDDLPRLIWHQDEPFGSFSFYAQWCVMRLAAQRGVTVLLDGQGGDEILAGYHYYFDYYWAALAAQGRWPELRRELAAYRRLFGGSPVMLAARVLRPFAPPIVVSMARHLKRGGRPGLQTLGVDPDFAHRFRHRQPEHVERHPNLFDNMLYLSLTRLNIPKLLHYEDRNSMAHSIEARVPFLDYRLVEYAAALPPEQKIKNGLTKVVLRDALKGILPEPIRMRTDKMGFVTPERAWLANELRDWVWEVVGSESFRSRGYFRVPEIRNALQAHAAGKRDLTALAWRWIGLELWFRHLVDK